MIEEELKKYNIVYLKQLQRTAINSRAELTEFINLIEMVIARKEIENGKINNSK